jgi:hypothetical protein
VHDTDLVVPANAFILGVDIGALGAHSVQLADGTWLAHPVLLLRDNGKRKLDPFANLALLESVADRVGGRHRLFVVYERGGKNRTFGVKNSFAIGQNEEFWRVLLTLEGFRFGAVHPHTWQTYCHQDTDGPGPKDRSLQFVKRSCPDLKWLDSHTKAQREGIVDAMCIALWARAKAVAVTAQPMPP